MSRLKVYVTPTTWKEIKELPGKVRQRIRKAVEGLAENPRPAKSKARTVPDLQAEIRRLRIDRWRIVYAITEADGIVDVLAVRKRPPYDYGDLAALLEDFPLK
ncbi:MAG TPA: type II toxin-antitoxin system RelE/ParE family toxin [Gemmataceae bacterium]|nr:type II toxin-antitoxin system RelE/ParE family toxin [Gemmataceae bacterium]